MAKKSSSPAKKARFQVYASEKRFAKNKKLKLEKHLKLHPEDVQAKKALKEIANLNKPSRSVHVASGIPEYKEITAKVIKDGKSVTVVERKIKITRLDKQLAKLVKNKKLILDEVQKEQDDLFKALTLAQSLTAVNEHYKRIHQEKLQKEGKVNKDKNSSKKPKNKSKHKKQKPSKKD